MFVLDPEACGDYAHCLLDCLPFRVVVKNKDNTCGAYHGICQGAVQWFWHGKGTLSMLMPR